MLVAILKEVDMAIPKMLIQEVIILFHLQVDLMVLVQLVEALKVIIGCSVTMVMWQM